MYSLIKLPLEPMSAQESKISNNSVVGFRVANPYIMWVHNEGSISSGIIFPPAGRYLAQFSKSVIRLLMKSN